MNAPRRGATLCPAEVVLRKQTPPEARRRSPRLSRDVCSPLPHRLRVARTPFQGSSTPYLFRLSNTRRTAAFRLHQRPSSERVDSTNALPVQRRRLFSDT